MKWRGRRESENIVESPSFKIKRAYDKVKKNERLLDKRPIQNRNPADDDIVEASINSSKVQDSNPFRGTGEKRIASKISRDNKPQKFEHLIPIKRGK